jgi:hypothetical protein
MHSEIPTTSGCFVEWSRFITEARKEKAIRKKKKNAY